MKWAIQAKEEEKNKPQIFSADGWTGESKIFTNVVKKWARSLLFRGKNSKNKWAEWLGRGKRKGDKGAKAFCSGWRHQPGQNGGLLSQLVVRTGTKCPHFVPVGVSNRDKTPWPPYPLPSPPPEPFSSFVLAVLGSGEGSSYSFLHHICEDLWFPVHPSALKVWGLFFSSSLACIAHFIL